MSDVVSVLMGTKVEGQKTDSVTINITGSERFRQAIVDDIFRFVISGDEINSGSILGQISISSTLHPSVDEDGVPESGICPTCDGSGEVSGDYYNEDGMTTCPECDGRGLINL